MGILEWRCRELRRLADKLGKNEKVSVPFVQVLVIPIMREAANTIERLQDKLQESYDQVPEQDECENESCSRWHQLFSTPERAARTMVDRHLACNAYGCSYCPLERCCPENDDYDALLEWFFEEGE